MLKKWPGDITNTVRDWIWHVTDIRIDLKRADKLIMN